MECFRSTPGWPGGGASPPGSIGRGGLSVSGRSIGCRV